MAKQRLTVAVPLPSPVGTLYGAKGAASTTSDLYTIDVDTGAATAIGPIGFGVTGLAFRPGDLALFGVTNNNSASNPRSLISIDPVTGAGTLIGPLGVANGIADIAFASNGVLYGYGGSTFLLYTINLTTGAATAVSGTPLPGGGLNRGIGVSFTSGDVLWVFPRAAPGGNYYTANIATNAVTLQGTLSGATGNIAAAAFDSNDLLWGDVLASPGPDASVGMINLSSGLIFDPQPTEDYLDAIAWRFPTRPPRLGPSMFLAPSKRGVPKSKLFAPYIVYPPPPPRDPVKVPLEVELVAVRTSLAQQRRRTRVLLPRPIVAAAPPSPPVETTIRMVGRTSVRVRVVDIRRRPMAGLRPPRFVRRNVTWPVTVWLAPSPRVRLVTYVLSPPTVINP